MHSPNLIRTPSSAGCQSPAFSGSANEAVTPIPKHLEGTERTEGLVKADRLSVRLRGLGPYVRALAARRGTTPAGLVRSELARMAREEAIEPGALSEIQAPRACLITQVNVRLSTPQDLKLASCARASGVSKPEYLRALLDGDPPAAMPSDHAALVSALRASTDQLAATTADLNAFMRLLSSAPSTQIDGYRAKLQSLTSDIQAHLKVAAATLTAVRVWRRPT
ncbi:hypothetical protein [Roseateles sp. LYH14W]|uniref:Ribbon-helix-helix protein, CopG family n=1 Tax=Pelomonas parva TaxID=3299032 RepID=A0ABW7F9M1_9BURK